MQHSITLLSGPPGAGKTTVSRLLAQQSTNPTVAHLNTDDFFNAIVKGYIEPWKTESQAQNNILTKAIAAAAVEFVSGGFDVIIDGVIGPWFLPEYRQAFSGHSIHYVVLRPGADVVAERAHTRKNGPLKEYPPRIYEAFSELGELEQHVINSSQQTPEETVHAIKAGLTTERFRLAS